MRNFNGIKHFIMSGDAARILGVCGNTLLNRIAKGMYSTLTVKKTGAGWQFELFDVFRFAYPGLDRYEIAKLAYQYRADMVERNKKKPRRGGSR